MRFADGKQKEYEAGFAKNDDPYGRRCFTYADEWAILMENTMKDNGVDETSQEAVADFLKKYAKPLSHTADTDGITGFMYGAAVSILGNAWIHGEQLRRWHNLDTQIGNEGEKANEAGTTLNPALLNIG